MTILFLILPLTILISASAGVAFAWATKHGQFDDLKTPALRMLHEEVHSNTHMKQEQTIVAMGARESND